MPAAKNWKYSTYTKCVILQLDLKLILTNLLTYSVFRQNVQPVPDIEDFYDALDNYSIVCRKDIMT